MDFFSKNFINCVTLRLKLTRAGSCFVLRQLLALLTKQTSLYSKYLIKFCGKRLELTIFLISDTINRYIFDNPDIFQKLNEIQVNHCDRMVFQFVSLLVFCDQCDSLAFFQRNALFFISICRDFGFSIDFSMILSSQQKEI